MTAWRAYAGALADELRARGDLVSPAWHSAVAATPRHVFVPRAWRQGSDLRWEPVEVDGLEGLALVYSTTTLVTKVVDGAARSSSTKPDLVVRMLELAEVTDDSAVLEIGTGSGYNAALLCHRLGDDHLSSVDVDTELVEAAQTRLGSIGYAPRLRTDDGFDGDPERAPYDRIIATCSVSAVPPAWTEQLAEGGRLLVTLSPGTQAGTLAVLRRRGDRVEGRFVPRAVSFMPLRRHGVAPQTKRGSLANGPERRRSSAPAELWHECPVAWLWISLAVPGLEVAYVLDEVMAPRSVRLSAPDGSWVELTRGDGERDTDSAGPTPLLDVGESCWRRWLATGRPGWERVGVTVAAGCQDVWLDDPDHGASWSLV